MPRVSEAFLLGALGALLSLSVFSPGFMSNDSISQLMQARSGDYTNIQPPLMSILWHYVDAIMMGQTGMLIIQNFLYWAGLALILLPFRHRPWVYFSVLIVIGLWPPSFLLQGAIWKDHLMSGFLLVAIGLATLSVMGRINSSASGVRHAAVLAGATACVFLALMMRHNAVFAVFPMLYIIAGEAIPARHAEGRRAIIEWRPMAAAAVATIAMFVVANAASDGLAKHHYKLSQLVAVFDILNIAAKTGVPAYDATTYPLLSENFTDAALDPAATYSNYDPCDAESAIKWSGSMWKLSTDEAAISQLWHAWFDAAKSHPLVLLAYKADVFRCSLGVDEEMWSRSWYAPIFFQVQGDIGSAGGGFSPFQKAVADQAYYWTMTPLYAVWIYFLLALTVALLGLFGKGPYDRLVFCIAMSGVMYQCGYLLIGLTAEFRYYIWLIMCSLLATALYLAPRLMNVLAADQR